MSKNAPEDVACVTSIFLPECCPQLIANYNTFRARLLSEDVPLLTVEMANRPDGFNLPATTDVLHVLGGDVMWQKERLIAHGIAKLLADGWKKIVWLDADIVFEQPGWAYRISKALDVNDIVQGLSDGVCYFEGYTHRAKSVLCRQSGSEIWGGAWAARSDFLEQVPLYDRHILGGGDSLFALATLVASGKAIPARFEQYRYMGLNDHIKQHVRDWHAKWPKVRATCVSGSASFLSHGTWASRDYMKRHIRLADYNPFVDVRSSDAGSLVWATDKPALHERVSSYFHTR